MVEAAQVEGVGGAVQQARHVPGPGHAARAVLRAAQLGAHHQQRARRQPARGARAAWTDPILFTTSWLDRRFFCVWEASWTALASGQRRRDVSNSTQSG